MCEKNDHISTKPVKIRVYLNKPRHNRVTTSITPVRTEADPTGPPGAHERTDGDAAFLDRRTYPMRKSMSREDRRPRSYGGIRLPIRRWASSRCAGCTTLPVAA